MTHAENTVPAENAPAISKQWALVQLGRLFGKGADVDLFLNRQDIPEDASEVDILINGWENRITTPGGAHKLLEGIKARSPRSVSVTAEAPPETIDYFQRAAAELRLRPPLEIVE